jgi:hypothetical protein
VQIFSADGSEIITTILAINNYRLTAADKTVITFNEVARGAPEAIRAWFYPGNNYGQEFVYPKRRAEELAVAVRAPVPAIAVEPATVTVEVLRTAPLVAVTPERREAPPAAVIQTTPVPESAAGTSASQNGVGDAAHRTVRLPPSSRRVQKDPPYIRRPGPSDPAVFHAADPMPHGARP